MKRRRKISVLGSRATSVVSVTLVLVLVGLLGVTGLAVHRAVDNVASQATVIVKIAAGTDDLQLAAVKRQLNVTPHVKGYVYSSPDEVLAQETAYMDPDTRAALEMLGENPFNGEFELTVDAAALDPDTLATLKTALSAMDHVDDVLGDAEVIGGATPVFTRIMWWGVVLGAVLLFISIVVITNTISLAIYSRRFVIHTMKLVGATDRFIRRPFVRSASLWGLVAGLIAGGAVCGTVAWVMQRQPMLGAYMTWESTWPVCAALVVAGMLICRIAAWCAATRYLNRSYDRLFK